MRGTVAILGCTNWLPSVYKPSRIVYYYCHINVYVIQYYYSSESNNYSESFKHISVAFKLIAVNSSNLPSPSDHNVAFERDTVTLCKIQLPTFVRSSFASD